jgi:hypothetical protein
MHIRHETNSPPHDQVRKERPSLSIFRFVPAGNWYGYQSYLDYELFFALTLLQFWGKSSRTYCMVVSDFWKKSKMMQQRTGTLRTYERVWTPGRNNLLCLRSSPPVISTRCPVRRRLSLSAFSNDADLTRYYRYITRFRGRVMTNVFLMIIVTASIPV